MGGGPQGPWGCWCALSVDNRVNPLPAGSTRLVPHAGKDNAGRLEAEQVGHGCLPCMAQSSLGTLATSAFLPLSELSVGPVPKTQGDLQVSRGHCHIPSLSQHTPAICPAPLPRTIPHWLHLPLTTLLLGSLAQAGIQVHPHSGYAWPPQLTPCFLPALSPKNQAPSHWQGVPRCPLSPFFGTCFGFPGFCLSIGPAQRCCR